MRRLLLTGALIVTAACSERNPVGPTSIANGDPRPGALAAPVPTSTGPRISGDNAFYGLAVRADGQSESDVDRGPEHIEDPVRFPIWQGMVVFPPRNEPNAFFAELQRVYRDELRRPQNAVSYVDPEGQNVWLTEYFRFWLNGCSHEDASSRTLQQITTGATLPTCGAERTDFPPRNLPNEFQGRLEATYRDVLRRPQMLSYVDSEGANVWLAQYIRFRTTGNCNHATAQSKVIAEIRGGGVQPDCVPPRTIEENFSGALSGGTTTTCSDGIFVKPCARFTFTPANSGSLEAVLDWSGSADLDLTLWRGSTLLAEAKSATRRPEIVSSAVSGGVSYSLVVTYYSGSTITNFTLRVTRPN
jgi:hypothetical protein